MTLKINYKDDKYQGNKKYQILDNGDGTVSIKDVTTYIEEGDVFSAGDINTTNKEVNDSAAKAEKAERLSSTKVIWLKAERWGEAAPYIQTIIDSGVSENVPPVVDLYMADSPNDTDYGHRKESYQSLDGVRSYDGHITFYCLKSKPQYDFPVLVMGVK